MKKLYYGGHVITMEDEREVEAVLVENGEIIDVGEMQKFQHLLDEPTVEKQDLDGKTLLPGFIDAHGHLSMMGPMTVFADLRDCESFEEIIGVLTENIEEHQEIAQRGVYGFGYDHYFLKEESHPTKDILNRVSKEIPIVVSHASGHVGCANDAALSLANIDANTPEKTGGVIGRIEGTNEPNGYLEEDRMMEVQMNVFEKLNLDYGALARAGQEQYVKHGITTVQDGATADDSIQLFKHLAENEELLIDIVAYPRVMDDTDYFTENQKHWKKYSNRFKINGYKLYLDGSPQAKTAWLTKPYAGEETYRGYPLFEDEQVEAFIARAIDDDMQLLTHCNGDAASDQLLNNYKRALEKSDNRNKEQLRPVMIHCQTVRDDQLDEMKKINMIPSIFVEHVYYWGDIHLKNLGEARGHHISPAKSAFDRGLVANFHQDAPVVKINLLHTIWCAVNRITRNGVVLGEDQRISVYEALQAVTIHAAYAYDEEQTKGSIKVGKIADFVILDQNPLTVDKMDIKNIQVLETIKEGETIYKRDCE